MPLMFAALSKGGQDHMPLVLLTIIATYAVDLQDRSASDIEEAKVEGQRIQAPITLPLSLLLEPIPLPYQETEQSEEKLALRRGLKHELLLGASSWPRIVCEHKCYNLKHKRVLRNLLGRVKNHCLRIQRHYDAIASLWDRYGGRGRYNGWGQWSRRSQTWCVYPQGLFVKIHNLSPYQRYAVHRLVTRYGLVCVDCGKLGRVGSHKSVLLGEGGRMVSAELRLKFKACSADCPGMFWSHSRMLTKRGTVSVFHPILLHPPPSVAGLHDV